MDRFKELQAKGWTNLNSEERAEYKLLKESFDSKETEEKGGDGENLVNKDAEKKDETSKNEVVEKKKKKTVEVDQGLLDGLMERIKVLEESNKNLQEDSEERADWQEVEAFQGQKIARLPITPEGKYIVRITFNRIAFDPKTAQMVEMWDAHYVEKVNSDATYWTEKKEITLSDYAKLDREEVVILDQETKTQRRKVGTTIPVKKIDYENFRTEYADHEVPLILQRIKVTCKVKLRDGSIISLDSSQLNT